MIQFGAWSIVLLLGAVQGLVVAAGLLLRRVNRAANVFLAALVFLLSLKAVPYVIGYAGFYMVYPWLDLAPFDLSLGFGPLLYLYITRLTNARLPRAYWVHLIPLALEFLAYMGLFVQPLAFKRHFEETLGPAFNTTDNLLVCASFGVYIALTWRSALGYLTLASSRPGGAEDRRLKLLRMNLYVVTATFLAFVGAKLWTMFVRPLSYYQMFPFYLLLMGVVYAFGFVAFKFSEVDFAIAHEGPEPRETDWGSLAAQYTAQLENLGLWSDPLLSLTTAAKALGAGEARLSKAINVGMGVSFSTWINRCRVERVAQELVRADPSETVFDIAQRCGFNSKASFNRWFRSEKGCTPTEFRLARSVSEPVREPRPVPPQCPPATDRP